MAVAETARISGLKAKSQRLRAKGRHPQAKCWFSPRAFRRSCILVKTMRYRAIAVLFVLLAICAWATEGTFRGQVVDPPANQPSGQGWIYIEGGNRMMRRVDVSHASIVYGEAVPRNQKHKCGPSCLEPGQEVLVTAEQDSSGEWRAKRVEIMRLTTAKSDPGSSVTRKN